MKVYVEQSPPVAQPEDTVVVEMTRSEAQALVNALNDPIAGRDGQKQSVYERMWKPSDRYDEIGAKLYYAVSQAGIKYDYAGRPQA